MVKGKLGISLYEKNYYEEEIMKIQDEAPIEVIGKVSNKKSTKKLIEESDNESIEESHNESIEKIDKESEEEFIEDLKETFSLNNKSTTNWYHKNKFNKILTAIDNNNFNHKNKIGKFKFNGINNLINNIKNNTISEADTKKKINKLIEIKNVETSLCDDLNTIFNNNSNTNNNNNNKSDNEN